MWKEEKTRKKELEELLKDFNSSERWERAIAGSVCNEDKSSSISLENREFLIQRYRSKFPNGLEAVSEDNETIQL